jgi:hypothetical protein
MSPGHCNFERAGGARGRAQWERNVEGFYRVSIESSLPGRAAARAARVQELNWIDVNVEEWRIIRDDQLLMVKSNSFNAMRTRTSTSSRRGLLKLA